MDKLIELSKWMTLPLTTGIVVLVATWWMYRIKILLGRKREMLSQIYDLKHMPRKFHGGSTTGDWQSAELIKVTKTKEAIEVKRERLLSIPNVSFHYADKDNITNFYNDYFREPTVENLVKEAVSEISGDFKGNIPQFFETKAGGRNLTKWISTVKLPDTSLNGMFLRYQREIINNNQVTLGLETADVELSDITEFEKVVDKLEKNFDFKIEKKALDEGITKLKGKTAEQTISKLENASGWVLVEGNFQISESKENFYKCTYSHPINSYLPDSGKDVTISFLIPKNGIETHVAGNYLESIDREIPLTVYGKIWQPLNKKQDIWELQITPLAVY